jgi:hypothetical protein
MPDPKDKKEKPKGWDFDIVEIVFILLILLALLGGVLPALLSLVTSGEISFFGFKPSNLVDFVKSNSLFFKALGFSIAGASAIGTFVLTRMGDAVWLAQKASVYPPNVPLGFVGSAKVETKTQIQTKWEKIIKLSESNNQSDWRLAIIEADIILDELLEKLQLPGDTMGDKLKTIEPSDFLTLDQAWEAHKGRNMIAHEGSDFLLNQRETRRIISLYEAVFKEFHLI